MKTGLLRKIAAAGIALMMLIALAPSLSLASDGVIIPDIPEYVNVTYKANSCLPGDDRYVPHVIDVRVKTGVPYVIRDDRQLGPDYFPYSGRWHCEDDGKTYESNRAYILTYDIRLVHVAAIVPISMSLILNSGGSDPDVTIDVDPIFGYVLTSDTFTRSGYEITSWVTEEGVSYSVDQLINFVSGCTLVLYAQWTQITQPTPDPTPELTPEPTPELTPEPTPEPTSEPTSEPTPSPTTTQQPTPSPVPTPKPKTVTFTYKSNYAGGQTNVTDKPIKGSSYTVRNNPFTREGYTFTGWNTKAKGTGTPYEEGQVITADGKYTLYAQWTEDPQPITVTFIYKANAGDSQADETDTVNSGSSYAFKSNPFTRSGYKFNGWNTQANGTGIAIKAGLKVTADETSIAIKKAQFVSENGIYTLYAQWK